MITRPVMRYHGGKFLLAPWIISHFPPHRGYVEPFGGAASVLLRKPRSFAEVYNEIDGAIVNVFRVLRDPIASVELARLLTLTPWSREEFERSYEPCDDPVESARRTVCRSFFGFGSDSTNPLWNTGFRASSNRSGTTPARDWMGYPVALRAMTERMRGVYIESRPAIQVMVDQDDLDVLHYVDPPYVHSVRGGDSKRASGRTLKRYRFEMTDDDHEQLAEILRGLRGFIVLSGYPSPLYDRLFAGWERIDKTSFADGGRPRTESIWLSPRTSAANHPRLAI